MEHGVDRVPCPEDFRSQAPSPLTLAFRLTNEFEQTFSASSTTTCWAGLRLADVNPVFQRDVLGGNWVQTRVRAEASTPRGFMLVQQTARQTALPPTYSATATIPQHEGVQSGSDVVVLPQAVTR